MWRGKNIVVTEGSDWSGNEKKGGWVKKEDLERGLLKRPTKRPVSKTTEDTDIHRYIYTWHCCCTTRGSLFVRAELT